MARTGGNIKSRPVCWKDRTMQNSGGREFQQTESRVSRAGMGTPSSSSQSRLVTGHLVDPLSWFPFARFSLPTQACLFGPFQQRRVLSFRELEVAGQADYTPMTEPVLGLIIILPSIYWLFTLCQEWHQNFKYIRPFVSPLNPVRGALFSLFDRLGRGGSGQWNNLPRDTVDGRAGVLLTNSSWKYLMNIYQGSDCGDNQA